MQLKVAFNFSFGEKSCKPLFEIFKIFISRGEGYAEK